MSRSPEMRVLDDLSSLLAKYIIDFEEGPIRKEISSNGLESGTNEIFWEKSLPALNWGQALRLQGAIQLLETDENASLKDISITNVDSESLLIRPENFSIRHFRDDTYGKACDYILFTRYAQKKYAIFIELKSKIYENPDSNNAFVATKESNRAIVWQMIGADALLDSLVDILSKRKLGCRSTIKGYKAKSSKSPLAEFKRRYIVLYQTVDGTGVVQPRSIIPPNPNALEKPIQALKVHNHETFNIGHLFNAGGLEP